MTGFFRDGFCHLAQEDFGVHSVCIQATDEFLAFSKEAGNDLSKPIEEFGFPGLKDGDRWCLCATRFKEAFDAGKAPYVILTSTNEETLAIIPLEDLKTKAIDLS